MASVLGGVVIACPWTPPTQPPPKNEGVLRNFPRVCSQYFDNFLFHVYIILHVFTEKFRKRNRFCTKVIDVPDQVRIKSIVVKCIYVYVQ